MSKFTDEDQSTLTRTMEIRNRLLHELTKGELPKDSDGVRMIRELADSMDKAVFTKAKINVDDDRNKIDEQQKLATQELVRSLTTALTDNAGNRSKLVDASKAPEFALPEGTDMDISEGDIIEGKDEIDPDPYIDDL